MTRYTLSTFCVLLIITFSITNSFANNLSSLITSLYGGNGVPVTKVFEEERPTGV